MQKRSNIPAIFISYAWGSESEAIAESVEEEFQKRALRIIRDKNDLGYKGRIKDFMEQIGRAKYVILIISNKYLRSINCMFELVQIFKNESFYERIFPVVLDEVKIARAADRLDLLKYWENEAESLSNEIKQLKDLSNIQGLTDDLNLNTEIRSNIGRLTDILKDTNTLSTAQLTSSDFEELYDAVRKKMDVDLKKETDEDIATVVPEAGGISDQTDQKRRTIKNIQRVAIGIVFLFVVGMVYQAVKKDYLLDGKKDFLDSIATIERTNDSLRILAKKNVTDTIKNGKISEEKIDAEVPRVRYTVELVVPSNMAQANVLVDGKVAEIIERSPISITVRLEKKEGSHHFEIIDGSERCFTDRLITKDNIRLTLCN